MLTIAALAFVSLTHSAAAPDLAQELAQLGRTFRDESSIDGFSMAVDIGGEIVFAGGFGWSDAKARSPADERSTFSAPELAGVWTTALVVRRVEDGVLELDAPLAELLPLAAQLEVGPELTLGHLVSNTSGLILPSDLGVELADEPLARAVLSAPRTATPGTCRIANPADTLLMALVLEHASALPLAELVRAELIAPLALEDTGPCPSGAPGAALDPCTTALDALRFQRALASGALAPDDGLESIFEEVRLVDGSKTGHGLGVDLRPLDDEPCWSYGGGPDGGRLLVAAYPRFDLTVVLLSAEDAPLERLERRIARAVLDRPDTEVKNVPLDPERATAYVGRFSIGCLQIDIERSEAGLVLHPPFGVPHVLAWQGDDEFIAVDDPDLRVRFELENGRAEVLILDDHGTRVEARRG